LPCSLVLSHDKSDSACKTDTARNGNLFSRQILTHLDTNSDARPPPNRQAQLARGSTDSAVSSGHLPMSLAPPCGGHSRQSRDVMRGGPSSQTFGPGAERLGVFPASPQKMGMPRRDRTLAASTPWKMADVPWIRLGWRRGSQDPNRPVHGLSLWPMLGVGQAGVEEPGLRHLRDLGEQLIGGASIRRASRWPSWLLPVPIPESLNSSLAWEFGRRSQGLWDSEQLISREPSSARQNQGGLMRGWCLEAREGGSYPARVSPFIIIRSRGWTPLTAGASASPHETESRYRKSLHGPPPGAMACAHPVIRNHSQSFQATPLLGEWDGPGKEVKGYAVFAATVRAIAVGHGLGPL
jgi:hypothetical protein